MNRIRQWRALTPISETLPVSLLLSMVGGFLEAHTYLLRGGVFCNAQTGNFALLCISIAKGDTAQALYYPIPILSFFAGVLLTTHMRNKLSPSGRLIWEHILIPLEIVLLFLIGLFPASAPNSIPNVIVAFLCSMQYHTFRKTRGLPFATTFCTNNLRQAAENLYLFAKTKEPRHRRIFFRYGTVILSFCCGALLGAFLSLSIGVRAIWLCCGLLLLVFFLFLFTKPAAPDAPPCSSQK